MGVLGFTFCLFVCFSGNRDSSVLKAPDCYRKVTSSNPDRRGRRIFLSRVNFAFWLLFGVRATPVLPQGHVKDLCHSAKSAGSRLHLNTHTPLTKQSRSGLTMPLPGIVWEPIRKRAHTYPVREHLVTVVSARWATVDWSWHKECQLVCSSKSPLQKKKKKIAVGGGGGG